MKKFSALLIAAAIAFVPALNAATATPETAPQEQQKQVAPTAPKKETFLDFPPARKVAALMAVHIAWTAAYTHSKFKKPVNHPKAPNGLLKKLEFYLAPWGDFHQPDLDPKVSDIGEDGMPVKWYPKCQPSGIGLIAAHAKCLDGVVKTAGFLGALAGTCAVLGVPFTDALSAMAKMLECTVKGTRESANKEFGVQSLSAVTPSCPDLKAIRSKVMGA